MSKEKSHVRARNNRNTPSPNWVWIRQTRMEKTLADIIHVFGNSGICVSFFYDYATAIR